VRRATQKSNHQSSSHRTAVLPEPSSTALPKQCVNNLYTCVQSTFPTPAAHPLEVSVRDDTAYKSQGMSASHTQPQWQRLTPNPSSVRSKGLAVCPTAGGSRQRFQGLTQVPQYIYHNLHNARLYSTMRANFMQACTPANPVQGSCRASTTGVQTYSERVYAILCNTFMQHLYATSLCRPPASSCMQQAAKTPQFKTMHALKCTEKSKPCTARGCYPWCSTPTPCLAAPSAAPAPFYTT
jgi:hypothetical protein